MKTLLELAEAYAQREDLHTEDGEYTKTTIINAYYDGAMVAIQTIFFGHASRETISLTNEDKDWLIEQINKNNG